MQLDPAAIRLQVENLKLTHPDLVADDEAWLATLESETDFNEVLTTIVKRLDDTEALHSGTAERIQELTSRNERFAARIRTLRDLAFKIMQAADLPKVELPLATLSLRAGTQQLIGDADPKSLPDELCKISRDLDRTKIKVALKTGVTVPGFQLTNGPPSLSIRIK